MLHILKLDSCRAESAEIEGDYETLYTTMLRFGGYMGAVKHYDTRLKHEYPIVEAGDTVLLSGSRLDAFADDEFTTQLLSFITDNIHHPEVRFIGVCYGHQIIARALGAEVFRASQFELGVIPLQLTEAGVQYFPEFPNGGNLIQVHKDQVRKVPNGAVLLAQSANCAVQSYIVPGKALCIQGHPEFTKTTLKTILEEVMDTNAVSRANFTIDLPYESQNLAYGFSRFALRQD